MIFNTNLLLKIDNPLWHKIESFEIDDLDSSFSFSDRLARENSWSMEYCLRIILEYKKFMYLICVSKSPLTPSDEIDQVWHLHLLYTQSYWIDFCGDVLKTQIHHGPTKGASEQETFKDQYQNTLDLYKITFAKNPPSDIWPETSKRFKAIHFSRVNRQKYWVIPKLKFPKS